MTCFLKKAYSFLPLDAHKEEMAENHSSCKFAVLSQLCELRQLKLSSFTNTDMKLEVSMSNVRHAFQNKYISELCYILIDGFPFLDLQETCHFGILNARVVNYCCFWGSRKEWGSSEEWGSTGINIIWAGLHFFTSFTNMYKRRDLNCNNL